MKSFYVTTPIYYVNDSPHIGHMYTTIAADAVARYKRLSGYRVFFLTGTDEHGQKVEKAARARGVEPQAFTDEVSERFRTLWTKLNISNDDYIRTTQERHKRVVTEIFKKLEAAGDIYLGAYEDWYCTPCESFWTESQLAAGKCPSCNREVEKLKEESYFFRMPKYGERLLEHIEKNPDFIRPEARRNEIVSFVKEGLRDLSISRTSFSWGVPVPGDDRHVIYVWLDALTNYITASGYLDDPEKFSAFWPADYHLIGKDILRFHAVYWPTFLMSAGLPLPKTVFAHGWWTNEGQKMSKSLGNFIEPHRLVDSFGVDEVRYFLLREIPFGRDGDFSLDALAGRIQADLAAGPGNLLNRVVAMVEKYFEGRVPQAFDAGREAAVQDAFRSFDESLSNLEYSKALTDLMAFVSDTDRYVQQSEPWALAKRGETEKLAEVLGACCRSLKAVILLLYPFLPTRMNEAWKRLGLSGTLEEFAFDAENGLPLDFPEGAVVAKGDPLFASRDKLAEQRAAYLGEPAPAKKEEKKGKKEKKQPKPEQASKCPADGGGAEAGAGLVTYDQFLGVDLRVARIAEAEKVEKSEKLVRLQVEIGEERRQIVAGIAKHYAAEDLVGRQVVVVANLKPAKLMGLESRGMLLAADDGEGGLRLVTFDGPARSGSRVK